MDKGAACALGPASAPFREHLPARLARVPDPNATYLSWTIPSARVTSAPCPRSHFQSRTRNSDSVQSQKRPFPFSPKSLTSWIFNSPVLLLGISPGKGERLPVGAGYGNGQRAEGETAAAAPPTATALSATRPWPHKHPRQLNLRAQLVYIDCFVFPLSQSVATSASRGLAKKQAAEPARKVNVDVLELADEFLDRRLACFFKWHFIRKPERHKLHCAKCHKRRPSLFWHPGA